MSLTGPIGGLANLAHQIAGLAKLPRAVVGRVAYAIRGELEHEFRAGVDPYGNAWAPLAASTVRRGRTPPPLTDKGVMRAATRVDPVQDGVVITVPNPATFHQTGWSHGPARPIVPTGDMPPSWGAAIDGAAQAELATVKP